MKITNILRALFLPITLTLLALGCILMFIGGIQWMQLDPRSIQRDGLTKPLDFFADCDLKAQQEVPALLKGKLSETPGGGGGGPGVGGGNATGGAGGEGGAGGQPQQGGGGQPQGGSPMGPKNQAGADLGTVLAERCKQQQRPYKWIIAFTAAEVGLTFLLLFWIINRASSGLLSWLGIQTAIVMAILIVTIYAAMQLQAQTKNMVDCQGWDDTTRSQVEQLGLTCFQGGNPPNSLKAFNYWSTIFWVGVGFAMGGLGLLTIMVPLMYWAKVRLLRHGGRDDEEAGDDEEAPATTTTGAYGGRGTGTTTSRRGDEHLRESDRDRYHSQYDRSTDRWGSGRAGTAGGRSGGRYGHEHEEEPSMLSRMTGGYLETDRDRREREYHGGGGERGGRGGYGDRDRDRGDWGRGGREEEERPSALNRMTGGYFGTEEDRRKEKEHGRDVYGGQEPGIASKMTGGFFGGDRERERNRDRDREQREYGQQRGTTGGVEMQHQPSFTDRVMGRSEAQPTAPGGVGSGNYPQISQSGQHSSGAPTTSSMQSSSGNQGGGTNTSGAPRTTTV